MGRPDSCIRTSRLRDAFAWFAALGLGALAAHAQPAACTSVSDDGLLVAEEAASIPDRLLFGSSDVPLPAAPDWTSDLVRAIGGMAFGDFDGDEDLDLALGCYFQSGFPPVNEYENLIHFNAGGTLETTPSWVSAVERHTTDCRVADLNEDGYDDIYFATGSVSSGSELYLGGPGGPSTSADWLSNDTVFAVGGGFGDIDGDGNLDLVQANQGTTTNPVRPVQVFFGDGTTLETVPSWQSADSTISNTVAIADLDGSSQVAVIGFALAADGSRRIFRVPHVPVEAFDRVEVVGAATPPHTLDRESGRVHFASPPAGGSTVEIDYRHASAPDVAFSRWVNYATAIYHNTGGGLPPTPTWDTGDASATDRGTAFSDVDGDDDLDLALGNSGDPTVLWRNDGGVLADTVWAADSSLFYGTQELSWGDVDRDGDEDLATIEFSNGHLRVFLNRGGELDRSPSWFYDFNGSATSLAWGDVNGDGFLDLAAGLARGEVALFLNVGPPTGVPDAQPARTLAALRAHPNPAPSRTRIEGLTADGGPLEIHDATGRAVRTLPRQGQATEVLWDGRDAAGRPVAPGVYFVRQESAAGPRTGRVVVLR
jgi:hypothetical protein